MGRFLANIQVHTAGRPAEEVRAEVVEAVRQWVLTGSFVETSPDDPEAERVLIVGPAGREPWIAVYDDFLDFGSMDPLVQLARVLSSAVSTAALAILVEHSDVLELRLYREGALTDAYSSDPDYHKKATPEQRRALAGRPRWRGRIEHVQSGKQAYFLDLDKMVGFIR